jgi:competence protein ComEA
VLGLAVCLGVWRWWPAGSAGASEAGSSAGSVLSIAASGSPASVDGASAATTAPPAAEKTWVHVVGAVRHPGLYGLPSGARVNDAVEAAGGFLGDAAEDGVNLARALTDGEQLVVPTADEFAKGGGAAAAAGGASVSGGASPGAGAQAAAVNINTATAEQLDALPGVGPATAAKIVAERQANGPFSSAEDLGRVAGIGPKKLADLRTLIVVR